MTLPAGLAVLALVVPAGISVAATLGADHGPVELEVTVQDWTGWSREQPAPSTRTVRVDEGDELTVDAVGGDITVTVVAISGGEVRVETDTDLASDGNYDDLDDRFRLDRPGSVEMRTPTLDGGTTITLTAR
ncbi:hypothetical protein [Nocardioides sp. LML1-1-1.1]|uniref:hypothetical protein n=1 Tax=Nocardioides sp. LML1-1-1.1 TaxID=3135248 RepID=UPI0034199519